MDITYPLLSIIFVGLGIVLIWLIPVRQAKVIQGEEGLKRFEAENEARRTLAQVLGGLLVLMSLYFTPKHSPFRRRGS